MRLNSLLEIKEKREKCFSRQRTVASFRSEVVKRGIWVNNDNKDLKGTWNWLEFLSGSFLTVWIDYKFTSDEHIYYSHSKCIIELFPFSNFATIFYITVIIAFIW